MFSGPVEGPELVVGSGLVECWWREEVDGDGGECGLLVVGLLAVGGVGLSWVMMVAGGGWAWGLGSSGMAIWWQWLVLAIGLGCAVVGVEWWLTVGVGGG